MDTEIEKTMGILTDLLHARAYDENYPTDSDLKEAIKELRKIVASVKAKDERIKELEEAMKPKTCLTCLCCNKEYQLMSDPPQYELKCGIFKTIFVNDSKQCCSKHTPKDNA